MKRNANGEGTFIFLPDGRVRMKKQHGFKEKPPNGRSPRVLTVTGKSKSECIKKMKKKEEDFDRVTGNGQEYKKSTLSDMCYAHLEYNIKNGELKPKSIDRREGTIKNQIEKYSIGRLQVASINSADIDNHIRLLESGDLSSSSIEKVLDVINAAYEWAIRRGDLIENPVSPVKKSIKKRLSKREQKNEYDADVIVMSEAEEEAFLKETLRKNANNGKYKYAGGLYGRLLLHTGMRVGELISLKWKDYDEISGTLKINKSTSMSKNRDKNEGENNYIATQGSTKNKKARVIGLSDEAIMDLKLIRENKPGKDNELICRTKTGVQYTATELEHCMDTIYRKLIFETKVSGLHIFRRTFATRMYEEGAEVKEIAAYIGDLESTTMQYYIAARKRIKINGKSNQYVPLPINKKENASAANRDIS